MHRQLRFAEEHERGAEEHGDGEQLEDHQHRLRIRCRCGRRGS
jgi:hypothetical protein